MKGQTIMALPDDIQKVLDDYAANVKSGAIVPWNPDIKNPTEHDEWLTEWATKHLPYL